MLTFCIVGAGIAGLTGAIALSVILLIVATTLLVLMRVALRRGSMLEAVEP